MKDEPLASTLRNPFVPGLISGLKRVREVVTITGTPCVRIVVARPV
jgi:hypothetical protein